MSDTLTSYHIHPSIHSSIIVTVVDGCHCCGCWLVYCYWPYVVQVMVCKSVSPGLLLWAQLAPLIVWNNSHKWEWPRCWVRYWQDKWEVEWEGGRTSNKSGDSGEGLVTVVVTREWWWESGDSGKSNDGGKGVVLVTRDWWQWWESGDGNSESDYWFNSQSDPTEDQVTPYQPYTTVTTTLLPPSLLAHYCHHSCHCHWSLATVTTLLLSPPLSHYCHPSHYHHHSHHCSCSQYHALPTSWYHLIHLHATIWFLSPSLLSLLVLPPSLSLSLFFVFSLSCSPSCLFSHTPVHYSTQALLTCDKDSHHHISHDWAWPDWWWQPLHYARSNHYCPILFVITILLVLTILFTHIIPLLHSSFHSHTILFNFSPTSLYYYQ